MRFISSFWVFTFFIGTASCQNSSEALSSFSSQFEQVQLPINVSKTIGDLHSNDKIKSIEKQDWQMFLSGQGGEWSFSDDYSYKTSFMFSSRGLLGLVYQRAYYPESILEEKSEHVLNVYVEGELKSSMPIQGYIGDNESFFCQINENLELIITREVYKLNSSGESEMKSRIERYKLNEETGEISPL